MVDLRLGHDDIYAGGDRLLAAIVLRAEAERREERGDSGLGWAEQRREEKGEKEMAFGLIQKSFHFHFHYLSCIYTCIYIQCIHYMY